MPIPVSINGAIKVVDVGPEGTTIAIEKGSHIIIDPEMKELRYLLITGECEENLAKRNR